MDEALRRLTAYGYDEDEARFLCLAAQHSGYFVRRQFNDFIGQARGARAQRFVEKLRTRRHALSSRFGLNQIVYHVRAKALYSRLGQADNRNRREKAPLTVKRKLMCLDFALAHPDKRFLTAEPEKVEYFVIERGIDLTALPGRKYQSRKSTEATSRFFVDKLPIFLDPCDVATPLSPPPVVHFVYVDEGAQSLEGFATYLRQYGPLLTALREFEVVYAATESRWFVKAEAIFHRMFSSSVSSEAKTVSPEHAELLDYFEARRKFDTRNFTGLDAERIVHFREQKRTFAGQHYDELYRTWIEGKEVPAADSRNVASLNARFTTYAAPHDYEMIRSLRHAS
ncbi:MAG: hypothetical protein SFV18_16195 [Bryobacteraceae bacterium]|nr:hypothetical protein [Bryobacteraceae bacterium]